MIAVTRFPDKEAGQIPMAYVVRKKGSTITESQVMDFITQQVTNHQNVLDLYNKSINILRFNLRNYVTIGGSIQENSESGVRGSRPKESLWQDT